MPPQTDKKTIQDLFEALGVIRKGTEDDFELRASSDEKVWGVKMWDEPSRPTYALYAGGDAKAFACDAADYDLEEEDEDEDGDDEDENDEDEGDEENDK